MAKKSNFLNINWLITIYLALFSFVVEAQEQSDPFFADIAEAMKSKPKISFRIDSRNSFISNKIALVRGYKIGLDYAKKIRLGIGFNRLATDFVSDYSFLDGNEQIKVKPRLHLEYISLFADYVFYKSKKWEFNLPLQLGGGYSYRKYKLDGKANILDKEFVLIYEANINGLYKIFTGVGVGVGTGYRIMLVGNSKIKDHFNSPIYIFRVKIFPNEILALFKGKP